MEAALQHYRALGFQAKGYLFDVTDEAQAAKFVEQIIAEHGKIEILVNNAGFIRRVPALSLEVSEFRKVVDVDLEGPFISYHLVAKDMVQRREGKIINICPMMSELGRNTVSDYEAADAA